MLTRCACHGRIMRDEADLCPCDICGGKSSYGGPSGSFCSECDPETKHKPKHPPVPEFIGFPKIRRYPAKCVITEKIDGTNAQILVTEEKEIIAGGRHRWLSEKDHGFGFWKWVKDHAQIFETTLPPGRYYGEWWGQGINRNYGLRDKRFTCFKGIEHPLFHKLSVLYEGPFSEHRMLATLHELQSMGSVAVPSYQNPEGIVVYFGRGDSLKVTFKDFELFEWPDKVVWKQYHKGQLNGQG